MSRQVMPNPLVHIVGGADGFGDFGYGAFDEGTEVIRGVFAEDEDVLRAVEVVGGYLRVVRQELLAVEVSPVCPCWQMSTTQRVWERRSRY